MENVRSFLDRKGLVIVEESKERSGLQAILSECPLCGKKTNIKKGKRRFYINIETGGWNTYCCGEQGGLFSLKQKLGDFGITQGGKKESQEDYLDLKRKKDYVDIDVDSMCESLWDDEGAREYVLETRKITESVAREHKLGYVEKGGFGYLAIPIYDRKDRLCLVKYRSIKGKKFQRAKGGKTILYNESSLLNSDYKECAICEAEIDALSFMSYGIDMPIVALTGGAQSGKNFIRQYKDLFLDFDVIYLIFDQDDPGAKATVEAGSVLGAYRCKNVRLDYKDLNECLTNGLTEIEIRRSLKNSALLSDNLIKHISEFEKDIMSDDFDPLKEDPIKSHIEPIDDLIHGFYPGNLTIITGDKGSGKSTLACKISHNIASAECPILIASPELTQKEVIQKLLCIEGDRSYYDMEKDDVLENFDALSTRPIYLYDNCGRISFSEVADLIEYSVRKHEIKVVLLDHLHFFIKPERGDNERLVLEETVYDMHGLSKKLNIHIGLVVHPKKLGRDYKGKKIKVELGDMKGTSEIDNLASLVLRVARPRGDDRSYSDIPKTQITALKVRSIAGREGSVVLRFHPDSLNYTEWDEEENTRLRNMRKLT